MRSIADSAARARISKSSSTPTKKTSRSCPCSTAILTRSRFSARRWACPRSRSGSTTSDSRAPGAISIATTASTPTRSSRRRAHSFIDMGGSERTANMGDQRLVPQPPPPSRSSGRWRGIVNSRWQQLTVLSFAELGALSLWFSASAVLPALTRDWQLGDGGRAGLTLAVQLGFIVGTLVSAIGNLPDVWSPRRLMAASAVLGAAANAALAVWVDSLGPALVLRFVTGAAMAGAYPPAMKIMATWFREGRGLAIGILVGALTVGSATPHLVRGLTTLPWRPTLLVASGLAIVAGALVLALVREGPYRFPAARFDARMAVAVFRERGARLACFGSFGPLG